MAEVIFTGPTPPRANPFQGLGSVIGRAAAGTELGQNILGTQPPSTGDVTQRILAHSQETGLPIAEAIPDMAGKGLLSPRDLSLLTGDPNLAELLLKMGPQGGPDEGFTLSPGQTRFAPGAPGASAVPIASLPKAPVIADKDPFQFVEGLGGEDGKTQGTFVLERDNPNPVAFFPGMSAQAIAEAGREPIDKAVARARALAQATATGKAAGTPPKLTVRDQKIADLIQNHPGISRAQATNVVDGVVELSSDPITAAPVLVNKATGQVDHLVTGATTLLPKKVQIDLLDRNSSIARVLSLMDGLEVSAELGTGAVSNFKAFVDATAGQFVEGVIFPDNAGARQRLREFGQAAKTAIVNNPKFPIAEQKMVEKLLPTPEAFFENPDVAVQNLFSLQQFLSRITQENSKQLQGAQAEQGTLANPFTPQTEEDFEQIPIGALFVNPADQQVMRKVK